MNLEHEFYPVTFYQDIETKEFFYLGELSNGPGIPPSEILVSTDDRLYIKAYGKAKDGVEYR